MASKWWSSGVFAVVALGLALPASGQTGIWSVAGSTLSRGQQVVTELPCEGTSVASVDARIFVACASGGVLTLDGTSDPPRPLEVRNVVEAVPVTRLFIVNGEVWAETPLGQRRLSDYLRARRDATVVRAPEPIKVDPDTEPEPEPPRSVPSPIGRVVSVGTGSVVIDLGEADGIGEGRWMEFYAVEDVDLGAGEVVQQERRVGVGKVDTVSENRAKVDLSLNERVPEGAFVRPDPEGVTDLGKRLTPSRPAAVWDVAINARPFLALGTLGGGAILDGSVGYRFDAPVSLDAFFHPFAFGAARDGGILTYAGNVVASYDTAPFQVGLGAGVSKVNTLRVGETDFIAGEDAQAPAFRANFSAAQFVRLGSVDGLHLSVLNNFILFEEEFVFGGITVDGAIPIRLFRDDAWIRARGGGGVPGHIFGELGIRILARGNGGPGSIFLTPTVGAGQLTGEKWERCEGFDFSREPVQGPDGPEVGDAQSGICRTTYHYGGPLIGFGVEWRL